MSFVYDIVSKIPKIKSRVWIVGENAGKCVYINLTNYNYFLLNCTSILYLQKL